MSHILVYLFNCLNLVVLTTLQSHGMAQVCIVHVCVLFSALNFRSLSLLGNSIFRCKAWFFDKKTTRTIIRVRLILQVLFASVSFPKSVDFNQDFSELTYGLAPRQCTFSEGMLSHLLLESWATACMRATIHVFIIVFISPCTFIWNEMQLGQTSEHAGEAGVLQFIYSCLQQQCQTKKFLHAPVSARW